MTGMTRDDWDDYKWLGMNGTTKDDLGWLKITRDDWDN